MATYDADIRWTTHGVAHITAGDWGSLGFGQGYACARDRMPTIADHLLKVRSQRSAFLGAGPNDRHVHSDLGYLALGIRQRAETMAASQSDRVTAMVSGYVAGYNAAVAEFGTDHLPAWCAGAPWIRPVDEIDFYMLFVDLCLMGSGRNLAGYIGSAVPPTDGMTAPPPPPPDDGDVVGEAHMGSNGWALGSDATGGPGMVMANPHFPWYGEGKMWECHLHIPGEIDVYGATITGSPGIQIGFNRTLAFTHTFSAGNRFTVYKLDLDAHDPCAYRFGEHTVAMTSATHSIEVLGDDGATRSLECTLWSSHHGPMVNLPFVGWSQATGFAYRDANIDNDRFLAQVLALDTATDIPSLQSAYATHGGLPWVNTMAADAHGRCWYIDSSPTPALSESAAAGFVAEVGGADPIAALMYSLRVAMLDGSNPDTTWQDAPGAVGPGLVAFDDLPQLERTDHVANANDPYWRINAGVSLPPHSPLAGLHHAPLSVRTRMNLRLVSGAGPVTASGPGGTVTLDDLAAMALSGHSLTALELRDAVVQRLRDAGSAGVEPDAEPDEELAMAADVLAAWDTTVGVDARGAVLWREIMAGFTDAEYRNAGNLWAEAFDPQRPLDTPSGLALAPATGPDPVVTATQAAVAGLATAGIAPDVRLGDVQWVQRGDQRMEIPGGGESEGVADVSTPAGALGRADIDPSPVMPAAVPGRFERTGLTMEGYPVTYGVSFFMTVALGRPDDPDGPGGQPEGRGLLVYGQSDLPNSPHHGDQVADYAARKLRPLAFTDDAIAAATIGQRRIGG